MAKIYASGNYVIVEDGDNLYEYAKGHTLYLLSDDIFYIKEITQGQYKVSVSDLEAGNITAEDSGDVYNVDRFTTFLRENTGFKTAPGGSGAEWGSIRGTLSTQSDLQSALNAKQNSLTLTTTGTSGASTLVGSTLNIPQYSGGGGSSSYPVKLANSFSGTQVTGQTLTISDSLYIPANTITQTNFLLQINATLYRTFAGGGSGVLGWLYLNTTNSLTGATLIARAAQLSTGQQWSGFNRNFPVRTSTAYGLGASNQFGLDYTSNSGSTFTFNTTQNNYLIFAISSVNVNDGGTWVNSKADLYV
jgi:hypothetical protein